MRYLTVSEYGTFLGLSGERLIVKQDGKQIKEIPLSRLRTICVLKRGVSVSGDLILSCSLRGIRILFLDWKGQAVSAVLGQNQHAVVSLRKSQFDFIKDEKLCCDVSKKIILSKVRNQRAVVLYFSKYQLKNNEELTTVVGKFVTSVNQIITQLKNIQGPQWKNTLFGLEGKAAVLYCIGISSVLCPCFHTILNVEKVEGQIASLIKLLIMAMQFWQVFYYQPLITLGLKCTPDFST